MNSMLPSIIEGEPVALDDPAEMEASIGRKMRTAWIALGVLVFGFLLAAVAIPIGGAVIAPGRIAPESEVKRIAHPTGGVIEEIAVEDGDRVKANDVLIRLDTNVSEVSAELTDRTVDQLMAERARLEAEVLNSGNISFPPELTQNPSPAARAAMQAELNRFRLSRAEQSSLRSQLSDRVTQLDRQIDGYNAQIASLRQQQALIKPELEGVRELKDRGFVTIRRLNELERQAVELEGSIGSLQSSIAGTQARIAEAREQQIQIGQSARTQAGAELARVETALNDQQIQSASAGDQFDRSVIRAPFAGVVDQLAYNAIGDVIRPAEPIMRIVPTEDQLVFEGMVNPADIDRIQVGQKANIRLSALNQATTPELSGEVTFVSAELVTNPDTGVGYYRIRVRMDERWANEADRLSLVSGMPVEIFVQTGSRSMLSYITKPLRDQFARAFRD